MIHAQGAFETWLSLQILHWGGLLLPQSLKITQISLPRLDSEWPHIKTLNKEREIQRIPSLNSHCTLSPLAFREDVLSNLFPCTKCMWPSLVATGKCLPKCHWPKTALQCWVFWNEYVMDQMKMSSVILTMKETIPQKEKKIQINGRKLPEKMSSVDINKNSQQNIAFKKRRHSSKWGKKSVKKQSLFTEFGEERLL